MSGQPTHRKLVLVVEDDPVLQSVMCAALEEQGFAVASASDGGIGLEMVSTIRPDLVVLDIGLPVLSGEEVAKRLQELFPAMPPVLVVSAAGPSQRKAQRMGAAASLAKPV
jgi:DNA-binding response OmpR family regulator